MMPWLSPKVNPLKFGTFHFIGIGGIGMSGIAEILLQQGYRVQGSDLVNNDNVARLRKSGVNISIGHSAENVANAAAVVVSSAIKMEDNPEVLEARSRHIPVVKRAEMLGEIMRLKASIAVGGTHGKTTTTSLVECLLTAGGLDPTVINGGIVNARGTNAWLGQGDWLVAESDESDGSFAKLPATISIITNIDPEHLDYYENVEALEKAFDLFVENLPFYGFAAVCLDDERVQALFSRIIDKRILTYGFTPQAEVRGRDFRPNHEGSWFSVEFSRRSGKALGRIDDLFLPMLGKHNVSNALAAISVASQLGVDEESIRKGLAGFKGVRRRFTQTGHVKGVRIIDDYGHHPSEIAAVLAAGRHALPEGGKIIAVVQPHRYTRLRDQFEGFCTCFNDAEHVLVADVYPAGEEPIEDFGREKLVQGLIRRGHRSVISLEGSDQLARHIRNLAKAGDLVICLGAGSISAWARALPAELEALF